MKDKMQISEQVVFDRMATLCARREYCAWDIRRKLDKYTFDGEIQERIITRLRTEKYIDETRYCRSFIHDKRQFNKWGRAKIESALRQKGIPQEVTAAAFSEISPDDTRQLLQSLLENKYKTVSGDTQYAKRVKLIRFALGRGFGMDETLHAVEELLKDHPE